MKQFVYLVFCFFPCAWSSVEVQVKEGKLIGTTYELPDGRIIEAFLGVPYAAPPLNKNRFKEPQPLEPWIGTWHATTWGSRCLQVGHVSLSSYEVSGSEDCLYLNIFTPKFRNNITDLMDVMVYFHGGAFMFGSGDVYPTNILQNADVVFIGVNYRLGVLGFLSTDDDAAPGNFGLKDQSMALKWIQNNIVKFGGNPKSVTIAGCSAGGASVHFHYFSPLSDGLFQKGISLSGAVSPPWTLPKNNTQKSIHLASLLGCPTEKTSEAVECLRRRPAYEIVETSKKFMMWRYCPFTPFGPVVEPQLPGAFLSTHPIDSLKRGEVKDLPWMMSFNEKEGLCPSADFVARADLLKELDDKWNEIAPNLLMYNSSVPEEKKDNVSSIIKSFYFNSKAISKETINPLIQMLGDRLFYNNMNDAATLHNLATKTNVYCYNFKYRGKYSLTNVFTKNLENYGVSHGDDSLYILGDSSYAKTNETEADGIVSKFMASIVINFMKTGNPSNGITSWKPLAKNQNQNVNCLSIHSSTNYQLEDTKNPTIKEFWRNILPHEQD